MTKKTAKNAILRQKKHGSDKITEKSNKKTTIIEQNSDNTVNINEPSGWDTFVTTMKGLAIGIVRDGSKRMFSNSDTTWVGVKEVTIENSEPDSSLNRKKELFYTNALIKSFYAAFNNVNFSNFTCGDRRDSEGNIVADCDLWGYQRVSAYGFNPEILNLIRSPHAIKAFLRGGENALKGSLDRLYIDDRLHTLPPARFFGKASIDNTRQSLKESPSMRNRLNRQYNPASRKRYYQQRAEERGEATERNYRKLYNWFVSNCKQLFGSANTGLGPDRITQGISLAFRSGLSNELVEDYLIISEIQLKEILPWAVKNQIHPEIFMLCCLRIFYMLQAFDDFSGKSKLNEQDDTDYSAPAEKDSALRDEMGVDWSYANQASRKAAKKMARKRVVSKDRRELGLTYKKVFRNSDNSPIDSGMTSLVDFAQSTKKQWDRSPERARTAELNYDLMSHYHGMHGSALTNNNEKSIFVNQTKYDIEGLIENKIKKIFENKIRSNTQLEEDFSLFNQLLVMAPYGDFDSEDLKKINQKIKNFELELSDDKKDTSLGQMAGQIGAYVVVSLPEGIALDKAIYALRDGARAVMKMPKKPPGKLFIISWIASQIILGLVDPVNKADLQHMLDSIDKLMKYIAELAIMKNSENKEKYDNLVKGISSDDDDSAEFNAEFDAFLKRDANDSTEKDIKQSQIQKEQNTTTAYVTSNGDIMMSTDGTPPDGATRLAGQEGALIECPKRYDNVEMQLIWCRWRQWRLSSLRDSANKLNNPRLMGLDDSNNPTPFLEDKMAREFRRSYRANPNEYKKFFAKSQEQKDDEKFAKAIEFETCPYVPKDKRLSLVAPDSKDPFVWTFQNNEMQEVNRMFNFALKELQTEFMQSLESTFVSLAQRGETEAKEIESRLSVANSMMQLLMFIKTALRQTSNADARITNLNYCDTLKSLQECKKIAKDIFNQVKSPDASFILQGGGLEKLFMNRNESIMRNKSINEQTTTTPTNVTVGEIRARFEEYNKLFTDGKIIVDNGVQAAEGINIDYSGQGITSGVDPAIVTLYDVFMYNELREGVSIPKGTTDAGTSWQEKIDFFMTKNVQFSKIKIDGSDETKSKLINDWTTAFQRQAASEGLYEKYGKNFAKGSMIVEFASAGRATFNLIILFNPYGTDTVFNPTGQFGTTILKSEGSYDQIGLEKIIKDNFASAYGAPSGTIITAETLKNSSPKNHKLAGKRLEMLNKKFSREFGLWSGFAFKSKPSKSVSGGTQAARSIFGDRWQDTTPNRIHKYLNNLRLPNNADNKEELFKKCIKDLGLLQDHFAGQGETQKSQNVNHDRVIVLAMRGYLKYMNKLKMLRDSYKNNTGKIISHHGTKADKFAVASFSGVGHVGKFNASFAKIKIRLNQAMKKQATDKDVVDRITYSQIEKMRENAYASSTAAKNQADLKSLQTWAFEFYRASKIAVDFARITQISR